LLRGQVEGVGFRLAVTFAAEASRGTITVTLAPSTAAA